MTTYRVTRVAPVSTLWEVREGRFNPLLGWLLSEQGFWYVVEPDSIPMRKLSGPFPAQDGAIACLVALVERGEWRP